MVSILCWRFPGYPLSLTFFLDIFPLPKALLLKALENEISRCQIFEVINDDPGINAIWFQ